MLLADILLSKNEQMQIHAAGCLVNISALKQWVGNVPSEDVVNACANLVAAVLDDSIPESYLVLLLRIVKNMCNAEILVPVIMLPVLRKLLVSFIATEEISEVSACALAVIGSACRLETFLSSFVNLGAVPAALSSGNKALTKLGFLQEHTEVETAESAKDMHLLMKALSGCLSLLYFCSLDIEMQDDLLGMGALVFWTGIMTLRSCPLNLLHVVVESLTHISQNVSCRRKFLRSPILRQLLLLSQESETRLRNNANQVLRALSIDKDVRRDLARLGYSGYSMKHWDV